MSPGSVVTHDPLATLGKVIVLGLCLLLAHTTSAARSDTPALTRAEARHLLTRTGFDPVPAELARFTDLTRAQAVDALLSNLRTRSVSAAPRWIDEPLPDARAMRQASVTERMAVRKRLRQQGLALQGWWLREMLITDSPLSERMTLFWHNHFTSALAKVRAPVLLYRQNVLFRRVGTRSFAQLLRGALRDPAMLVYLDNHRNHLRRPNENLARELLELFTLGEGHYTERDVREAARALTGHGVERGTGQYRFRRKQHDFGNKTFLDAHGALDLDDIVTTLLRHPRTATFLSEKLWAEFVGGTAPPKALARLAGQLRRHDYAIEPWLRTLFLMPGFISSAHFGTQVKSPVEFVVGLVRMFEVPVSDARQLARATHRLGQSLFNPPSVKGWPGGNSWINADTLIVRNQLLGRFLRGAPMADGMRGSNRRMRGARRTRGQERSGQRELIARWLAQLPPNLRTPAAVTSVLLPLPPVAGTHDTRTSVAHVEALLMDPVYQLK